MELPLRLLLMLIFSTSALAQFSGAGTMVLGKGGLNGWQQNAPTISALTATPTASSVVLTWTTSLSADTRAKCGTQQAPDNGVAAAATSHSISVPGLAPSTAYTCTVQSGSTTQTIGATTTAVPASTPITGLVFGSLTNYNTASPPHTMNGDTYYNAVSNDGITYLITDDTTTGWDGLGQSSAVSLAKFTSLSPITGTTVNTLSGYGPCCSAHGTDGNSPKGLGLISIAGNLCMTFSRLALYNPAIAIEPLFSGSLICSPDHGATWNNMQAPGTFTSTGAEMTPAGITLWGANTPSSFAGETFIMYGADDGTYGYDVAANQVDNADAFIYVMSNDGGGESCCAGVANGDHYYLARAPRAKMLNLHASDWQFYVSGDGSLDAAWSPSQTAAQPVATNVGKLGLPNIQEIPALNRLLLSGFYYPSGAGTPSSSVQTFYEAPHPWCGGTGSGCSWTQIASQTFPTTGNYSPIVLQASALSAALPTVTITMLSTQNFLGANYNLFYQTVTVSH